jgi:transposase
MNIIQPLLHKSLDSSAGKIMSAQQVAKDNNLSAKTISRYLKAYKEKGFDGLIPAHNGKQGSRVISEGIIYEALLLRRWNPALSVKRIIAILERENRILPGSVKRTTLYDQLVRLENRRQKSLVTRF